jgi:hypothetical protein
MIEESKPLPEDVRSALLKELAIRLAGEADAPLGRPAAE